MSRQLILDEIDRERDAQDEKWGHQLDDTQNTPWMWTAYIAGYAAKWMKGTFLPLQGDIVDGFRACMIKTAALAVAAVESLDRQRAAGKAFYEETE